MHAMRIPIEVDDDMNDTKQLPVTLSQYLGMAHGFLCHAHRSLPGRNVSGSIDVKPDGDVMVSLQLDLELEEGAHDDGASLSDVLGSDPTGFLKHSRIVGGGTAFEDKKATMQDVDLEPAGTFREETNEW